MERQFRQYQKPPPDHRIIKLRDIDDKARALTAHLKVRHPTFVCTTRQPRGYCAARGIGTRYMHARQTSGAPHRTTLHCHLNSRTAPNPAHPPGDRTCAVSQRWNATERQPTPGVWGACAHAVPRVFRFRMGAVDSGRCATE